MEGCCNLTLHAGGSEPNVHWHPHKPSSKGRMSAPQVHPPSIPAGRSGASPACRMLFMRTFSWCCTSPEPWQAVHVSRPVPRLRGEAPGAWRAIGDEGRSGRTV